MVPSARPEYSIGELQVAGGEPSSEQRNVAPPSFASNVSVAVVSAVVPEGPEVIVTLMAGLATAASGNERNRNAVTIVDLVARSNVAPLRHSGQGLCDGTR